MSSWNDVTKKVRELRKNFIVRCVISFVAVLDLPFCSPM